jgi:histidyl-tRNA synthetase
VLRALDKLAKVGPEAVAAEMVDRAGVSAAQASRLLALAALEGDNDEVLGRLEADFGTNETAAEGIRRLRELLAVTAAAGVPGERFAVDLSIARGLDYYTGTVYETFLDDLAGIGSVCSGGRYDDLASLYTKAVLPGVGASLGLDRLIAALEQLGRIGGQGAAADVLCVLFDAGSLAACHGLARELRAAGIGVEVYPEARKVGAQLGYAERRGYSLALIAGPDELASGAVGVKDLRTGTQDVVARAELADDLARRLGR